MSRVQVLTILGNLAGLIGIGVGLYVLFSS